MTAPEFVVETDPRPDQVEYLEDRIYEFNSSVTGIQDGEWLAIFVRSASVVTSGYRDAPFAAAASIAAIARGDGP